MRKSTQKTPSPSPEEIRRKCLEIQDSWNVRQRASRSAYRCKTPWVVPVESVGDLDWHSDDDLADGVWSLSE